MKNTGVNSMIQKAQYMSLTYKSEVRDKITIISAQLGTEQT